MAEEFRNGVLDLLPQEINVPIGHRCMLLLGACDLIQEHHGAILDLLREGRSVGSALALVRPVLDARNRALWLYHCASEEQASAIANERENFKSNALLLKELNHQIDFPAAVGLLITPRSYVDSLHDFTHGGAKQLLLRFSLDSQLEASYPDSLILSAVLCSSRDMNFAYALLFELAGATGAGEKSTAMLNALILSARS